MLTADQILAMLQAASASAVTALQACQAMIAAGANAGDVIGSGTLCMDTLAKAMQACNGAIEAAKGMGAMTTPSAPISKAAREVVREVGRLVGAAAQCKAACEGIVAGDTRPAADRDMAGKCAAACATAAESAKGAIDACNGMTGDQSAYATAEGFAFMAPVTITAAADGEARPGPRRFEMLAYTGGPLRLKGWQYPVVVDLDGIEGINRSRPILHNHDTTQRVGHTDAKGGITAAAGRLYARGPISGTSAIAREVCAEADNGFPWQASIGARPLAVEFIAGGETGEANGRTFEGPINIARRTKLGEISFVTLGADDETSARIAANRAAKGMDRMNFQEWLAANGFVESDLTEKQLTTLKAAWEAQKPAGADGKGKKSKPINAAADGADDNADPVADTIRATREAAAAEVARINTITAAAKDFPEIQATAIKDGWSAERCELEVLRASRKPDNQPKDSGFYLNTGQGAPTLSNTIMASAVALSCGMPESVALKGLDDKSKDLATHKKLRGIGIRGAIGVVGFARGLHVSPLGPDEDFIRAVLQGDLTIKAADMDGGYATMSLSGITENVLNKAMLMGYDTVESVVPLICYETDNPDFKIYKRYMLTASGGMQEVGPAGELKSISLQDESYPNQVKTVGGYVTLTRQNIINDDMGALTEVTTILGRQAALARERGVFTVILALGSTVAPGASVGQTANAFNFFSSGARNYISGGTSVLGITGLTLAEQKFLEQKDANNDPILVSPGRVLVPPALKTTAVNLFNGQNLVASQLGLPAATSGTAAAQLAALTPTLNPHVNKYTPTWSPYLGTQGGLAGASDTAWYLLPSSPAGGRAMVQIGYLRGQRTPIMQRGETSLNTLGIGYQGFYDFGVAAHNFRFAVKSAGV